MQGRARASRCSPAPPSTRSRGGRSCRRPAGCRTLGAPRRPAAAGAPLAVTRGPPHAGSRRPLTACLDWRARKPRMLAPQGSAGPRRDLAPACFRLCGAQTHPCTAGQRGLLAGPAGGRVAGWGAAGGAPARRGPRALPARPAARPARPPRQTPARPAEQVLQPPGALGRLRKPAPSRAAAALIERRDLVQMPLRSADVFSPFTQTPCAPTAAACRRQAER